MLVKAEVISFSASEGIEVFFFIIWKQRRRRKQDLSKFSIKPEVVCFLVTGSDINFDFDDLEAAWNHETGALGRT